MDRRQPVRRQQAGHGRDRHRRRGADRPAQHRARRSSASAPRATTSRRRSRRWAGSSTSTAASRTSAPTARPSSTASTTRSAISASSSRAAWRRRSTQEFATNIDFIDCLPPGLYEAVLTPAGETAVPDGPVVGDYVVRFEQRTLDDIRALGCNDLEDERKFAAVARLSEINLGLYRTFLQPWVRAATTEQIGAAAAPAEPRPAPVRAVLGQEPVHAAGRRGGRARPRESPARRRRTTRSWRPRSSRRSRSWRHWTATATGATPWSEASFHADLRLAADPGAAGPTRQRRPATASARPRARGDRVRPAADRGARGADGSREACARRSSARSSTSGCPSWLPTSAASRC